MSDRRIAILGAGRLGESMLRGFLSSGWREPGEVVVTSRRAERRMRSRPSTGSTRRPTTLPRSVGRASSSSVKPQDVVHVLAEIAAAVSPEQTLLSVAAGVTTASIESRLPDRARVVRAMPNAPALVHEGIAGICGGDHARDEDLDV